MALASAERQLLRTHAFGHDLYVGYATVPLDGGGAVVGGNNHDQINVTNTNDSGAGSLRQALADAAAAGGGYILITVSGTLNPGSTLTIPSNVTIDARGVQFKIVATSGSFTIISFTSSSRNIILRNFWIEDAIATGASEVRDIVQNNNCSALWRDHITVVRVNEDDGSWDTAGATAAGRSDTRSYCKHYSSENFPYGDATSQNQLYGNGADEGGHGDKYRATWHHNWDRSRQRQPLGHMTLDSFNNLRAWTLAGIEMRNSTGLLWSENDTFDASDAPSSPTNRKDDGIRDAGQTWSGGGDPSIFHTGERLLGSATLISNQGSVTDPDTVYGRNPCTANADHDTWIQNASGAKEVITLGGTLDGEQDSAASGKTVTLTLPSTLSWPAAGSAFDAIRQNIIDSFQLRSSDGSLLSVQGSGLFTSVTDVVRTSAPVVTCTASANVNLAAHATIYWAGDAQGQDYWLGWNTQSLLSEAPGGSPGVPSPQGARTFSAMRRHFGRKVLV